MEIRTGTTSNGISTVTDGVVTVTNATTITFSGATVTDGGGGNAVVTITGTTYWARDAGNGYLYPTTITDKVGIGTNTPTSILTVEQDALGGSAGADTTSVVLRNTTAAALGAQQVSPGLIFSGNGWSTTSSASMNASWRIMNLPAQGTAAPTSTLQFQSSINGAAYVTPLQITSAGTLISAPAASTTVSFQSNGTATSSNFVVITTGYASQSIAQLTYGGAASTMNRAYMRGSTTTTAAVSSSIANFIIGTEGFTTAASGTHAWASSLVLKPLTISIGTATVTNSATVYIEGSATGASNNYSLYVAAGTSSFNGDIRLDTVGNGLYIKEGANATSGLATLAAGTLVVNTTKVTANSRIQLTGQGGNIVNLGSYSVTARTAGTSFTISSSNVLDTNTVAWVIVEPA